MEGQPAIVVAMLWIAFAGTHLGLATRRVRGALVARFGESGFMNLFSLVATILYAALVAWYALHRFGGAPGLALGRVPVLREALIAVTVTGIALAVAGLAAYARLPSALYDQPIGAPRGIERITRHPFFAGVAMVAIAHVLLATRLVGAVFAAGFAVLAIAGAWHQDRKLARRRGPTYTDHLAVTSAMPLGAVLGGRQRLAWHDLPLAALAAGILLAVVLRAMHYRIFAYGGAGVILAVVAGGALASWQAARRAQRIAMRDAAATGRAYSM